MTLIPVILPISNALIVHFLKKETLVDKSVLGFYTILLVSALFFGIGMESLARTQLYKYLPYTLIWILLSLVYFVAPTVYAAYTVRRLDEKRDLTRQMFTFAAYFSLVYMLMHIRVTSNWQVIQTCAQPTY
jgi:hypothetical protein